MESFERAEPSWIDVALIPEKTKALTRGGPGRIEGSIRLGLPIVRAITHDELDAATARQHRADLATFRYHLVQLACSLRPPDGEHFGRAFIHVKLEGGTDEAPVIAYSLDPMERTITEGRSTRIGIGADLGLISIEAEHERTASREVATVVAYGVRTGEPSWELKRAGGRVLQGSYYFAILTRSPIGIRTRGTVSLTATIEKWRFVTLESAFPDGKTAAFTIEVP